ncbi:protocatechuate 3,4-dioxygenase subunit beta [Jannaschia aquimarina]|uniref:PcaH protein n=1 Tax=Jannaschia aquimarina TaxID=935700 RepID=A0A0D1EE83_9RHOB|nr:protocatechuate 3,4-dioxygenase subunit beta [Jannaschia aquimarina]KIT15216.1 Protocatechuate 3,4-dioxygenase beta chain [Jannaschia aquimarina]SNT32793.1 protocatechuate 3,4-dioxygenase beta subunit [Jannaschia aquimarina]
MTFRPRDPARHPPALAPAYKTSVTRSPRLPLLSLDPGPTERTGPVFRPDDLGQMDADLLSNYGEAAPIGERILIHGRVLDGNGRPVPHTLVEVWQANASGRYRHVRDGYVGALDPDFGGCGRCLTGEDGTYAFRTVKPGAYPWRNTRNDWRPAHIHFSVFGTAFLQRLVTQCYFEGDPLIARCPIAQSIGDPVAVDALVANLDMGQTRPFDMIAYRFDIVLRGRRATWFET